MIDCNKCHRPDLKVADMVQDKSNARGHKSLCKSCKTAGKMAIPKINKDVFIPMSPVMSERQKRQFGGSMAYKPRVREEHEATGWLISKMAGTYVPEDWHTRPDGKHIKSLST